MGKFVKDLLLFLSVFVLLSLPGLLFQQENVGEAAKVTTTSVNQRNIASVKWSGDQHKGCRLEVGWRSRCEADASGKRLCKKDLKQTYLLCDQVK